jgi:hypothetical protein
MPINSKRVSLINNYKVNKATAYVHGIEEKKDIITENGHGTELIYNNRRPKKKNTHPFRILFENERSCDKY